MGACFATHQRIAALEEIFTAQNMQIQELEGSVVRLEEVNEILLRDLAIANKNCHKAIGENVRLKWQNSRLERHCHTLKKRCERHI